MTDRIEEFLSAVKSAFAGNTLVKLKLAGYHGGEADLKSIDVKKIVAKGVEKFSFTFHYKTRDIIKNQIQPEALGNLRIALKDEFRSAQLATTEFDMSFERNGDKIRLKRSEVAGRHSCFKLLRKIRGDIEAVVPGCFCVRDVRGDGLLTQDRCIQKLPSHLVIVGLKDRVDHASSLAKQVPPSRRQSQASDRK